MKRISWDPEKNTQLKAEWGVCSEDVIFHVMAGDILQTLDHPTQKRYHGQQIHVIAMEGYVHHVPFVESEGDVYLKTIIANRKATKSCLGEDE
ncbi:MAG: toxin [Candidatus Thiodiazotropha sp.]